MDALNEKERCRFLKKYFSQTGWLLLIYYGILNVSVLAVALLDAVNRVFSNGVSFQQALIGSLNGNAWGYFVAAGIGLLCLHFWKGFDSWKNQIWAAEKPIRCIDFWGLLGLIVCGQLFFQFTAQVIEKFLNLFGLSAMLAMEGATTKANTLSMFLYAGILAPLTEELLFRGVLLRILLPGGKKFAILTSAFLFGIFHANVVQTPFAFVIGLILGYAAVEYSVKWSILLHVFNNLVLSEILNRVFIPMPVWLANYIYWTIMMALALIGVIVAFTQKQQIGVFISEGKISRRNLRCFFKAPGVIVVTVWMLVSLLFTITPLR